MKEERSMTPIWPVRLTFNPILRKQVRRSKLLVSYKDDT